MENIVAEVKGQKLILTIDLKAPGTVSSTGKSKLIASSRGAWPIDCGQVRAGVKVALNVTVPNG